MEKLDRGHRGAALQINAICWLGMAILEKGRGLVQAEFVVQGGQRALHGVLLYYQGDVVFGGALGDGHDVYVFAAQGGEGAAGYAGDAAHVFADYGDDGDVGIAGDVFDGLLGDFWGEGVAQGFEGALLVRAGDDEADVVLR